MLTHNLWVKKRFLSNLPFCQTKKKRCECNWHSHSIAYIERTLISVKFHWFYFICAFFFIKKNPIRACSHLFGFFSTDWAEFAVAWLCDIFMSIVSTKSTVWFDLILFFWKKQKKNSRNQLNCASEWTIGKTSNGLRLLFEIAMNWAMNDVAHSVQAICVT